MSINPFKLAPLWLAGVFLSLRSRFQAFSGISDGELLECENYFLKIGLDRGQSGW